MKRALQQTIRGSVLALSLGLSAGGAWAQKESTPATPLGKVERASKLVGKEVYSSDNQKIGDLENAVVDLESGRILYTVVDAAHGKVAVPPGVFREPTKDNLYAKVDKEKLDAAPQFTSDIDKPEALGKTEFVSSVYQYFGQTAWWQGQSAATGGQFNNALKVTDLDGSKIVNESNQKIGKVEDTALQLPQGRVVYAILNPDSSLKLGDSHYAIPPNALTWNAPEKRLTSNLSREQLAAAPHFGKDNWAALSSPSFATKVYQYYGKEAWFQPGGMEPTGR